MEFVIPKKDIAYHMRFCDFAEFSHEFCSGNLILIINVSDGRPSRYQIIEKIDQEELPAIFKLVEVFKKSINTKVSQILGVNAPVSA